MLIFTLACWQALILLTASTPSVHFQQGCLQTTTAAGPTADCSLCSAVELSALSTLPGFLILLFYFSCSLFFSSLLNVFTSLGNKADPLCVTPVTERMLSPVEHNLMNSTQTRVVSEITALYNCSKSLLRVKGVTDGSL